MHPILAYELLLDFGGWGVVALMASCQSGHPPADVLLLLACLVLAEPSADDLLISDWLCKCALLPG